MKNLILNVQKGLNTKFDSSIVKFKNTFASAKRQGVDLNDTNIFFKRDGFYWKVSFTSYKSEVNGRYTEVFNLLPYLKAL